MSTKIDEAIDALRKLSPARQEEVAGYIKAIATDPTTLEETDPAHLTAIMEGLAQFERGEFASEEEVEAAFRSLAK